MPHIVLTNQQTAQIRRHMAGGLTAEEAARVAIRMPDLRGYDLNVDLHSLHVEIIEPRPVGLRFGERVPPRRQTPAGRDVSPPARDWNRRTLRESGKRRAA